jgi:hypothetical protein
VANALYKNIIKIIFINRNFKFTQKKFFFIKIIVKTLFASFKKFTPNTQRFKQTHMMFLEIYSNSTKHF